MSVTVGDKNKSVQSILDYTASPRPIRAAANNLAKKEVLSIHLYIATSGYASRGH